MEVTITPELVSFGLTAAFTVLFDRFLQRRPKLITYYSSASVYNIPGSMDGYPMYFVRFNQTPTKAYLEQNYNNKFPLLISHKETFWFFSVDIDGNSVLVKINPESLKPYNKIEFADSAVLRKYVDEEIYQDIQAGNAYTPHNTTIHTHEVVVKNTGENTAYDVVMGHTPVKVFYNIYPCIRYEQLALPNGGFEIKFPALLPGEQVTVSYLYFPPTIFDQVNTPIKYKDGFAKVIKVIPSPNVPKPIKYIAYIFMFTGAWAITYYMTHIILTLKKCCF